MRSDDVLGRLRAADPAERADLSRVDKGAFDALREGIVMANREASPSSTGHKWRNRRRMIAAGLGAVMVGGGVAVAESQHWFGIGGIDGVNCQAVWNETAAGADTIGGPWLTGDPIADCERYREEAGLPALDDPVAFEFEGLTFVTPRSQVPEGGLVLDGPTAEDAVLLELGKSLGDWVDGFYSQCYSMPDAVAVVEADLDRLGLDDWSVAADGEAIVADPDAIEAARAAIEASEDAAAAGEEPVLPDQASFDLVMSECPIATVDAQERIVHVMPNVREDYQAWTDSRNTPVADALREGITNQCLTLDEATELADEAVGPDPLVPTAAVLDESASCARVDMEVGGLLVVTVYGPTEVRS